MIVTNEGRPIRSLHGYHVEAGIRYVNVTADDGTYDTIPLSTLYIEQVTE